MTLTTIQIWSCTNQNVRMGCSRLFAPLTLMQLDNCNAVAGFGLLHPRTTRSQVYDMIQMVALWYIVAMVPVSCTLPALRLQ
jgi:hypothetical protein